MGLSRQTWGYDVLDVLVFRLVPSPYIYVYACCTLEGMCDFGGVGFEGLRNCTLQRWAVGSVFEGRGVYGVKLFYLYGLWRLIVDRIRFNTKAHRCGGAEGLWWEESFLWGVIIVACNSRSILTGHFPSLANL